MSGHGGVGLGIFKMRGADPKKNFFFMGFVVISRKLMEILLHMSSRMS